MKLKTLEMHLEQLKGFDRPDITREQYITPATIAARLLFDAYMRGDIEGKRVCDLGCGTGILACGAALLGAGEVIGVDVDSRAIAIAKENARLIDAEIVFITGDVRDDATADALGSCDTVVMNPPFGAQLRHADRPFIDRALSCGRVVYGIFNEGSLPFVTAYITGKGTVESVVAGSFPLRRTFAHHRKELKTIKVEIVRITRAG